MINLTKLLNLAGAKKLYDDLRDRIEGKYTKPDGGIPSSDIAPGVIPDPTELIDDTAGAGDTDKTWSADKLSNEIHDASGKADKVPNAVSGNFAGLDANGNLTDSGKKASDFATTQDLANKADKADTVLDTTLSRGRVANSTVGTASFAFGNSVTASGNYSHAEGSGTTASGSSAHAEGSGAIASASNSHAEGGGTQATAANSHAEGGGTLASASNSHAEGGGTQATAPNAHAEGGSSQATGDNSHGEGLVTMAIGDNSHAEGSYTQATAENAHAEGGGTLASALDSHAEGCGTIASGAYSHIGGTWNVADSYGNWLEWTANTAYAVGDKVKRTTTSDSDTIITGYICKTAHTSGSSFSETNWNNQNGRMNYAEIIGNGSANLDRSNIRALDWDGNERLKGDLYVGCNADSTGGTKVAKITDIPTVSDMTGATSSAAGTHGLVPAPAAGDDTKFLRGDGTWGTIIDDTSGDGDTDKTWSADKIAGVVGDIESLLSAI